MTSTSDYPLPRTPPGRAEASLLPEPALHPNTLHFFSCPSKDRKAQQVASQTQKSSKLLSHRDTGEQPMTTRLLERDSWVSQPGGSLLSAFVPGELYHASRCHNSGAPVPQGGDKEIARVTSLGRTLHTWDQSPSAHGKANLVGHNWSFLENEMEEKTSVCFELVL